MHHHFGVVLIHWKLEYQHCQSHFDLGIHPFVVLQHCQSRFDLEIQRFVIVQEGVYLG